MIEHLEISWRWGSKFYTPREYGTESIIPFRAVTAVFCGIQKDFDGDWQLWC